MAIPWSSSDLLLSKSSPESIVFYSLPSESTTIVPKTGHKFDPTSLPPNNYHNTLLSRNFVGNVLVKPTGLLNVLLERDTHHKMSTTEEERNDGGDDDMGSFDGDYSGHALHHTGLINQAFLPMRLSLMALGRWPFSLKPLQLSSRSKWKTKMELFPTNRVGKYEASLKSPLWVYFGGTTLFLSFVLVMSTLGFLEFFLLPGNHSKSSNEGTIFRNNLVAFLLVWGCLLHSTVSSLSLFINRRKVAKILNFWNVAADELLVVEVNSLRRFLITSNLCYILFLVLVFFAYGYWKVRLIREGAQLFGILAINPFLNDNGVVDNDDGFKFRIFGIIAIIYAIHASRSFLFIFCFKCRLLRNLFRLWNTRLVKLLRMPDNYLDEKMGFTEEIEKVKCQRLLRDMTILLKMVKQMDKMFATILQSYYGVQLLNMCFELYMLAKSGTEEFTGSDSTSERGLDIICAALTLCQNVYFFFTVSLDGAYVGEEAAKGAEVLRRYPLTPQSSVQKKFLIYNLGFIYNQKITLTGGKFFTIDRPFVVTVLGAVLTYFVIIMQIEPYLA